MINGTKDVLTIIETVIIKTVTKTSEGTVKDTVIIVDSRFREWSQVQGIWGSDSSLRDLKN